jgi:flagellin-like protein
MNKNKRGVSPLIATVLLIAFAVALGAVVMNWGRTYVTQTAQDVKSSSDVELACEQDVGLDWVEIGGVDQICYGGESSSGFIFFMVKNTESTKIESLGMNVIGSTNVLSNSSINGTSIEKGKVLRKNITYDYSTYGSIDLIELVPEVKIGGVLQICSKHTLSKSSSALRNCSA